MSHRYDQRVLIDGIPKCAVTEQRQSLLLRAQQVIAETVDQRVEHRLRDFKTLRPVDVGRRPEDIRLHTGHIHTAGKGHHAVGVGSALDILVTKRNQLGERTLKRIGNGCGDVCHARISE